MAACLLFNSSESVLHWRPVVAKLSLLVAPVACLFIGWRFNRFNPALAIFVFIFSELFIHEYARGVDVDPGVADFVTLSVSILLPLNLAFLACAGERGIFNLSGLCKSTTVVVQPFLAAWVFWNFPDATWGVGNDFLAIKLPLWIDISNVGLLAFMFSLTLILVNLARKRGAVETGFIWSLIAGFLGLAVYSGLLSTICFTFGSLILAVSVVEAAYTMAYRDELTGLPARRSLNELFLKLSGRYSVAMLDIDFFKKFNDTYGHDVGDQVLKMVASRISRVRGGGSSFRYGGEEFTVVFPGKAKDETIEYLEELRKSVEGASFFVRDTKRARKKGKKGRSSGARKSGRKVGVTVSIGVASRDTRRMGPEEVVKAADKALYRAKGKGRNCLVS